MVEAAPAAKSACQAVILGTSTGGPVALKAVLPRLPAELPVPVLVVQHMPADIHPFSWQRDSIDFANWMWSKQRDEMEAVAGKVIIAAGGKQMKLISHGDRLLVRVTDDPPENGVRPSVDYTASFGRRRTSTAMHLAVIMTGMGRDGLEGCRALKQAGGYVFAQCQSDCVVYGMPKAVIEEQTCRSHVAAGKSRPGNRPAHQTQS